jgi:hypothetical protein
MKAFIVQLRDKKKILNGQDFIIKDLDSVGLLVTKASVDSIQVLVLSLPPFSHIDQNIS